MKKIFVMIVTLAILLTGCQLVPTPSPTPRPPLSLSELERTSSAFESLASAEVKAWNTRDNQLIRTIFTEDAVMRDRTYSDFVTGPDEIIRLIVSVASFGSKWEAQLKDSYIAKDEGITVSDLWNLGLGGYAFTQADPMVEVDRLKISDNHITNWTLFYGLDSIEKTHRATSERLEEARALLSTYQMAWSSGDPQVVGALYSSDTVREDTLFGERQEGQAAIRSFAKSYTGWYPGVLWDLSLAFGEGQGDSPVTGGLYTVQATDLEGQPCIVQVAVLLQTSENLISHETIFYEPQSLIRCGWAR